MEHVIIIGAGIIGSTLFYELTKHNLTVCIIEKNEKAGLDITGHNSAIIHNGTDPAPNTLKAKYNIMANAMYEAYCQELETPFKRIGAYVLAKEEDINHIDLLVQHAKERSIQVTRLTKQDANQLIPNLNPSIVEVLDMPTTAIIDPTYLSQQAIKKGIEKGGTAHFNEEVIKIDTFNDHFIVYTTKGSYSSHLIINASGLYASEIEQMVSQPSFKLHYRKGEYLVLSSKASTVTSKIIYPVPSPLGKGVLFVPTVHGTYLVGPNAIDVTTREDTGVTEEGIQDIKQKMAELVSNVPYHLEIDRFSGIRPQTDTGDFIIQTNPYVPNFINCVGIESPGISSAPAIAKDVVETLILPKLKQR